MEQKAHELNSIVIVIRKEHANTDFAQFRLVVIHTGSGTVPTPPDSTHGTFDPYESPVILSSRERCRQHCANVSPQDVIPYPYAGSSLFSFPSKFTPSQADNADLHPTQAVGPCSHHAVKRYDVIAVLCPTRQRWWRHPPGWVKHRHGCGKIKHPLLYVGAERPNHGWLGCNEASFLVWHPRRFENFFREVVCLPVCDAWRQGVRPPSTPT